MGLAYQPHYAGLAVDYSNLRGLLHAGFVDAPVFADALAQHRFILGRQQRRDGPRTALRGPPMRFGDKVVPKAEGLLIRHSLATRAGRIR